jgi:tyrosinase
VWLTNSSNIDRAAAIWQILNDDKSKRSWFDGTNERDMDDGTFSIAQGTRNKPSDPLRPFHKDEAGTYWTSNDCRDVTPLGYTYPGLEKWRYTASGTYDRESHLKAVRKDLNRKYNSARIAALKSHLTADPGKNGSALMSMQMLLQVPKAVIKEVTTIDDYIINVIYER